ncbi:MAG: formate--tetrahydrofolate ligase, partial [Actinomycetes bacterium]
MSFPSDIDIARKAQLAPLSDIAEQLNLPSEFLEPYGRGVAKIKLAALEALQGRPLGKYVVVTAITPTPLGEGKTTTSVGLGQAMGRIGKKAVLTLRQP